MKQKGFSLLEIIIVMAVIGLLSAIVIPSFNGTKTSKVLKVTSTNIDAILEQVKGNALAGKDGLNQGIYFTSTGYTPFEGTSYASSNSKGATQTIDGALSITTTAPSSNVIFSRISGNANAVSTTTISITSTPSKKVDIVVGTLGDISMIQY